MDFQEQFLGWHKDISYKKDDRLFRNRAHRLRGTSLDRNTITYDGDGHLITFAPTGAGKGVSSIIPNLCLYTGSIITVDPKAENFYITAKHRKKVLGQKIILIDPFKMIPEDKLTEFEVNRDTINPLKLINTSDETSQDSAITLAEIIAEAALGKDPYWDLEAKKLLSGIIEYVINKNSNQGGSLDEVISILYTSEGVAVDEKLERIVEDPNTPDFARRSIRSFTNKVAGTERSSVLSVCQSYLTQFIGDQAREFFGSATFDPLEILQGGKYSIYICIPTQNLFSHPKVLRLIVGSILHTILQRNINLKPPTLFLLDECAQLGYLDEIMKGIAILRGFGAKLWMFFQNIDQLKGVYGGSGASTIIENCGVIQYFGQTRDGKEMPFEAVFGDDAIELIKSIKFREQFLSIRGKNELVCRLPNYLFDSPFKGKFEKNPYHI